MIKSYFSVVFLFLAVYVCNAQESSTMPPPPPIPIYAEGCEDVENISDLETCTNEKLQKAAFEALSQKDIENVLKNTEKEIIFMNTELHFDKSGKLASDKSSLKFHERELKFFEIDLSFSLEKLPFKPSPEIEDEETSFTSYLFLKLDRDNKKLIPLPNHEPERIPFSGVETYIVYPGCESKTTNEELKKCMSDNVTKHVAETFDTEMATKLNLEGIQRILIVFTINKEGTIGKTEVEATHPRLRAEAERVIRLLPKMKPGKIEGTPVNIQYALPLVFKIQ